MHPLSQGPLSVRMSQSSVMWTAIMYWETDPLVCLWWTLTYTNFVPLPDTTLVVGFISQDKRNKLGKVQEVMKNCYTLYKRSRIPKCNPHDQGEQIMLITRNNYNHLDCFPLTWCDIITAVAESQHSAMEFLIYFNYHEIILPSVQTRCFCTLLTMHTGWEHSHVTQAL
jgi:hypothetical protein